MKKTKKFLKNEKKQSVIEILQVLSPDKGREAYVVF